MEMTIGANIKRLRSAKNITQEQLSVAMNVTCAAVSKWERGETYPDITLLQPLAYFFEVTLDELMGYDQKKVQAGIDETISLYRKHRTDRKGREIIVRAYHDYPNDYWIMHYYMWNIAGDLADNDPAVLVGHKEEFHAVCEKFWTVALKMRCGWAHGICVQKFFTQRGRRTKRSGYIRQNSRIGLQQTGRKPSSCSPRTRANAIFTCGKICMSLVISRQTNSDEPCFSIHHFLCQRKQNVQFCTAI